MAESDRPAVYIELLRIDTQILAYRQRLCGKCFVSFYGPIPMMEGSTPADA